MRIGRVASATEPPNCMRVSSDTNIEGVMQSMMPYFKVIRNIVVFASGGPKHRITGLGLI